MYPWPVLFDVGSVKIFTYGLFLLLGFFVALWISFRRAREKLSENHVYNVAFVSLVIGIVGARGGYILLNPSQFSGFSSYFGVWHGGLSFFGGLIFSVFGVLMYVKIKKLNFWQVADVFTLPLLVGVAVTRVGGFLAGVNPGIPTALPWAVLHSGVMSHPVALYYVLSNLVIFFILLGLEKPGRFLGFTFSLFLVLYGMSRFALDFFRAYETVSVIVLSRVFPLFVVAAGLILLLILGRLGRLGKRKV